jgi:hypothetical protein
MAEEAANKLPEDAKKALDLNSLSGLDFGPNWADPNAKPARQKSYDSHRGERRGPKRSGAGSSRDRRSGGRPNRRTESSTDRRDSGNPRSHRSDRQNRRPAPYFESTVKVDLYPQDEAFDALIKRLRSSARTYQLFDIAQLLLEKPDRFVVVVSPKIKKNDDGSEAPKLYYSVPGHLPFETEEEAVNHVMTNHLDLFFDIEEIEVEAPKGNFPMVNRCTITGELLGPPNYHRYQEFLQQHYASRITGMSFERFTSKIEGVKEQEQIDAWLESMKKGARYTVKDRQEGETESLETLEAVRIFLLQHRKDRVVGFGESIRFAGRDLERLPKGNIRGSVEAYVENQKHFPLDSANNIRGRLRRHKFAVYKKGSKGASFVCAVKRKFRDANTVFTDSIRDLIEFVEKHPDMPASKLPKEYIGIDTEKQKPEALEMTEAEVEAAAQAKAAEATQANEESKVSDEGAPITQDAKASTEATPMAKLSEDEQKKLNQLMLDLRWLITEGYVTEYGDGKLYAPPPMPEPKKVDEIKVAQDAGAMETMAPEEAASSEADTIIEEFIVEAQSDAPKIKTSETKEPPSETCEKSEITEANSSEEDPER